MIISSDGMPVAALVDLVNGWGTTPRREAGESDLPFPSAASIAEALAVPVTGELCDEPNLCRLADTLYPVFATEDAEQRTDLVTRLLGRFRVRPGVAVREGRIEEVWDAPESDSLGAAAVVRIRDLLLQPGPDRLGTCAGMRCGDVYVDASPAGHRRYCSVTCQNRARVAAFRRRRSADKSVAMEPPKA